MPLSDYEKFQQQMFDQLDELERAHFRKQFDDFIKEAKQCGIDVLAELDKGRRILEILAEVRQKQRT